MWLTLGSSCASGQPSSVLPRNKIQQFVRTTIMNKINPNANLKDKSKLQS